LKRLPHLVGVGGVHLPKKTRVTTGQKLSQKVVDRASVALTLRELLRGGSGEWACSSSPGSLAP
jgi:hypothetical protein